ncbi:hypothetical protein TRAPUB_7714 [Trametes pubescens]|uniref:Uncharacterized protein n=1 Tax=Trametes pubescens TaxID=154538 RepID=A0A1M2V2N2_TRAPU|nr:hypothetical protein TRAPUB_7714 [Trametes pubescens]
MYWSQYWYIDGTVHLNTERTCGNNVAYNLPSSTPSAMPHASQHRSYELTGRSPPPTNGATLYTKAL